MLVDKPRGITSFDVVAQVRRLIGVRRIGHTGTLDPMATGLLPICIGEATKLVPFLTEGNKSYEAVAKLGVTTDSGDADGKVIAEKDASHIAAVEIAGKLPRFVGAIDQIPPMHSAIRIGGKRLYELARAGQEIKRESRRVHVYSLTLLEFRNGHLRFSVECSKGTYVRTLATDVGEALGVGAHLTELRRTASGLFRLIEAVALDRLSPPFRLVALADALSDMATVTVNAAQAKAVRDGKSEAVANLTPSGLDNGQKVRLLLDNGNLLAVAEMQLARLKLKRVFV